MNARPLVFTLDKVGPMCRTSGDCAAVLVAKIGHCPMKELQAAGIEPVQDYAHEYIEASALAWFQQRLDNRGGAKSLVA